MWTILTKLFSLLFSYFREIASLLAIRFNYSLINKSYNYNEEIKSFSLLLERSSSIMRTRLEKEDLSTDLRLQL